MIRSIETILLSVLFSFGVTGIAAQQNLFDFDNSLKFARHLKFSGQYDFAAEEFERLRFMYPADSALTLELSQVYRLGNQCSKLSGLFTTLQSETGFRDDLALTREYLRYSLRCKVDPGDFHTLSSLLPPGEKAFYELGMLWLTGKDREVIAYNQQNSDLLTGQNLELHTLTLNFEKERFKVPAVAALMSAVIPGSGKAYSGRWGDALVSMLFIGSNSYAAYRAFRKKGSDSVHGWIFGTLAFSFYSGNIWGSAKAARNYNHSVQTRYRNHAEIIINNSY